MKTTKAEWEHIKNQFISSDISMRDLRKLHGKNPSTLMDRARREKWSSLRREYQDVLQAKTIQLFASQQARENVDRLQLYDGMIDKVLYKLNETIDLTPAEAKELRTLIQALKDMGYIIGYIAPNPDAERETGGVIVMPDVMSVNDSIDKIHTVSEFGSYNGEE